MKRQHLEEDSRRYPLYWPEGYKKTPPMQRKRALYKISAGKAREDLQRELVALGARSIVVSTNVPYRPDGLPYANAKKPEDVGVAVYWTGPDKVERVIACDKWLTVEHNLRGCGLAIEAIRALERTGASEILDRAFRGFAALPATTEGSLPWRKVFEYEPDARPTFDQLKLRYRDLARKAHPDVGGVPGAMAALNRAYTDAQKELGYP